ncbi:M-spondin [Haematobia irritans]|uniref:M-spondin n=1 Tax=Haematobia irritans TaxID=7368 RepID=UPI003F4FEC71
MKKPPSCLNMLQSLWLIALLPCLTLSAPSVGSIDSSYFQAGYVSSPSIYSYTIENQIPLNQSQKEVDKFDLYQTAANSRNLYYTASSSAQSNSNVRESESFASQATLLENSPGPTQSAPITDCTLDRLAVYKVVLHTYWTRDLFPKHYPDWRPAAQWTKTIGRTHDAKYALYHMGQQATSGVKQFAETGKSDILDTPLGEQQQQQQQQQQKQTTTNNNNSNQGTTRNFHNTLNSQSNGGERSVFDEFNLPAITTGAGRSEAKFFVDSNHSLVSLMTRIVPSPDWFIGVDSFQLCVGGSWIDTVTVEMDPLDAGTDNGFTFTAPNWPTSPQGVIYRITSRYPAHPAGSFFYPKSKRLPPMATFQFIKLKEYELSEVFNFAEDDRKYETVKTQTHLEMEHNHVEMNNELSASIERERQNEIAPKPTTATERDRIRSKLLEKMNPMNNNSSLFNVVPKNDKNAIMQNIANSYRRSDSSASLSSSSSSSGSLSPASSASSSSSSSNTYATTTNRRRRTKRPRDCRVSHWSEWSACSKSCGIGEMHRYRKIIKHGKRGGRPCPPLKQSKWCGSEKGCHSPETYFNWSDT